MLRAFLTLVLNGGERSVLRPAFLSQRKEALYPSIGGWLGLNVSLGAVEERKSQISAEKTNSYFLAVQPVN
jgi:hypothetical protein